jgi:hypothetical protein
MHQCLLISSWTAKQSKAGCSGHISPAVSAAKGIGGKQGPTHRECGGGERVLGSRIRRHLLR